MKKELIFIIFFLLLFAGISINLFAQDADFSQNFSNPLALNPAYAGSLGCSRFVADYRNQYPSISTNDITYCASYDQYVEKLSGGIGLLLTSFNNGKGEVLGNEINGIYSYNIRVNNNFHIRPAVNIGIGNNRSFQSFTTYNPPPLYYKKDINYFNAGAGVLFAYKNFISGVAYDHINRPDVDFFRSSNLLPKLTFHLSLLIKITDKVNATPCIFYQFQHNLKKENASLMIKLWHIKLGVAYMLDFNDFNPHIIAMLGFVNNWMSIGFSNDYVFSATNNNCTNPETGGIKEITAIFKFNCKNNKKKFGITKFYGF